MNDFAPFFIIVVFGSNSHRGRLEINFISVEGGVYLEVGIYAVINLTINIQPHSAIRARCECRQFFLTFATRGMQHSFKYGVRWPTGDMLQIK